MTTRPVRRIPTANALLIAALPLGVVALVLVAARFLDGAEGLKEVGFALFWASVVLFPGLLGALAVRSDLPAVVLWLGAAMPAVAIGAYSMRSQPFDGQRSREAFTNTTFGVGALVAFFFAVLIGAYIARRMMASGHPAWGRFLGAVVVVLVVTTVLIGPMTL